MSSSKNSPVKGGVYLPEAVTPPGLGWSSNSVGSESGQIQSAKLLQNIVYNRTQHPYPLPATYCLYILYFDSGKGDGGSRTREKVRGATVHNARSKIPIRLTVSPVNKHR